MEMNDDSENRMKTIEGKNVSDENNVSSIIKRTRAATMYADYLYKRV